MSKPKRIILIRHGESEGNINPVVYETIPDFAIKLSQDGVKQSLDAGIKLKEIIQNETVKFYVSPFYRTRETYENIIKSFPEYDLSNTLEDPRLIEQNYGHLCKLEEQIRIRKERDLYSPFYYRLPNGEAGIDVYSRISTFIDSLHRDFNKEKFPDNVVIVSHGLTIRLFLMRWFKISIQEFELIHNPKNCEYIVMNLNLEMFKYELQEPLKKYDTVYHNWKY